jgi:ABC-type polysaccharide/polyol phosphate export permease
MPEFLFSGILWPSIGMIPFFKTFADILPVTLSCELARNMVNGHAFR